MKNTLISLSILIVWSVFLTFNANAQDDPNPNSPSPILLAGSDVTRVLAVSTKGWSGGLPRSSQSIFKPSARAAVTIFISGDESMLREDPANAFRVFITQRSGKTFEMQTDSITPAGRKAFALNIKLFDQAGYRGQPVANGDSGIYVTWRGQMSNVLKIGLGSTGGYELPPANANMPIGPAVEDAAVGYRFSGDRKRLMEQATFGPSTDVDFRIRRIGLRGWLNEQFEAPYPSIPFPNPAQMPIIPPANCGATSNPVCFRERYTMSPLQQWFFLEAMYGNAQLRHRTAWALSQIWVTSGNTVTQSSHAIAFHKILAGNAFGNYRTLMSEATLSPTMGFYLDMIRSTRVNPNENYPREILQLFSIGLNMLNPDGTPQRDGSGNPIPTYSQETVNNLSKVFTGWTYCNLTCTNSAPGVLNYKDPMILVPANHDTSAKTLLSYPNAPNVNIPACGNCTSDDAIRAYAEDSFDRALDNIFNHPNVGPYIGRLLIQHLVTSDPSPAYVARVAAAFDNNGANVRGDMRAVVRAILLDPEARGDIKTAPRYGKLREPVQLITNLTRLFPARDFSGEFLSDGMLAGYISNLQQNAFNSPTVFNYFSPDFIVPSTTINGPEFELLNTGSAVKKTNLLYLLVVEGLTANATDSLRGTSLDYSELLPIAAADQTGNQMLDVLDVRMMHSTLDPRHRSAILTAVQAVPADNPLLRLKTAVYLIAASSQYQVQR